LQHQLGDDNQALDLAARAFAIRERTLGPNHPLTAESVNNLGAVHWALKEYGLALPLFKRALEIKEKTIGPEHPDTGTAHNNLGELYRARGEWLKAVEHVNRAYTIWEKSLGPEHPRTAAAVSNLADLYWRMGDPVKSRAFYEKALAIKEKALGPEHPETAQAVNILAAFCQSAEDYDRSLALYKRGLALEDRLFENVFSVASEEQKLAFVEKSQGHYLAALSLIHRHFREDPQAVRFGLELVLRRKGIVLDSESRAREALVGQLEGKVLQVWQRMTALRSDLSRLLLSGPGDRPVAEHRTEIDKLQAAIAQEEEFLSRHSALAAGELSQRRVTVEAVAGRLPKDGVLVEFVLIRDWDEKRLAWARTGRYLAFVLTPDDRIRLVDLGDAAALHEKIAGTRAAISDFRLFRDLDAYTEKTEAGLSDLYGSLLQPLGEPVSSRQQLVLSPDGALNEVPFPALRTPDGQYLVEQRTVSHVSSGRDLLRGNTGVAPTLDLLLVANPKFDDEQVLQTSRRVERALRPQGFRQAFGALPGTAEEARIIPPLLAGTRRVLVEDGATESAVREARSPRVLHLATHGFFLADRNRPPPDPLGRAEQGGMKSASENPMIRSGLALAGANYAHTVDSGDDGILTAWEVSGMSLQGTDLVVLSACETGLGEIVVGEGVQGLRRAFVQAGARNLVMSLWPVDDQVTRDLMERFYRGYGHGEPVAMALRKAQIETIASLREELRKSSHGRPLAPVNLWAPFIVQQTGG
jgi:CHAT domain-containing protein/tetratricopeptide (TPR) repeat protein